MKKTFLLLTITLSAFLLLTGCTDKNLERATDDFNKTCESVEENNTMIRNSILELQALMKSGEKPLDPSLIDSSKSLIREARSQIVRIPEMPTTTETIRSATEGLMTFSNPKFILDKLETACNLMETSIEQLKLVTNPTPEFVKQRLADIPNIRTVQIVTEENDPEGLLNQPGGYVNAIYFTSDLVPAKSQQGGSVKSGGAIEIYETEEDANKRNEELSTLDGTGMFSGASHSVLGTMVIRISDKMAASRIKKMEKDIYDSLTQLK